MTTPIQIIETFSASQAAALRDTQIDSPSLTDELRRIYTVIYASATKGESAVRITVPSHMKNRVVTELRRQGYSPSWTIDDHREGTFSLLW